MHHAYLIIAHNEFEVLQLLVNALDDERNDIYVHIDKKIRTLPSLSTSKSRLYMLDKRIDVRWGHVSQIKTELLLFETALANGPYDFYHLISGTHLPLKSQDEIHAYFENHKGESLFSNLEKRDRDYQEILKMHRINICIRGYASSKPFVAGFSQFLWKSFIALQRINGSTINNDGDYYCANNWCSLSHHAVEHIVNSKKAIIRKYRWTFCGDEWFAPTELKRSDLAGTVLNCGDLLYGTIGKSNALILTMDDLEGIRCSNCLFARKFTSLNRNLLETIICGYEEGKD